ncbi:hypothetical protein BDV28DRAFT_133388 [Aspergillus coremiiformis]|uniref:Uncharacterized protein n=1 Tax=Aspergillus coremiiformis TaxID=138285 RepID=A0A5N6Z6L3_9EURO|nr:hypothetical protein BDV28DRAFT_133388 [Aspergillus coremiiformis]
MDEINQQVFSAIEKQYTIRVVADIPTDHLCSTAFLASAFELVRPFVTQWEADNMIRQLAVDVYPRHTYVVVDINNEQYDYDTAHKQTFTLPVYILRLSSRSDTWTFFRRASDDQMVARCIADLHRRNGQNPLPFLADHINGSVYRSPRKT